MGRGDRCTQIEGAWNEDGKGKSIWDRFSQQPGKVANGDTPFVACDHYHRYESDVEEMKRLGVKTYRFSFAWPRILPQGKGAVNQKGLDFYKRLVERLLQAGIVPNATLYHWDLPQALEDAGGWPDRASVSWFEDYAGLLFETFGSQISLWATFNEPVALLIGYGTGYFAPGHANEKLARQAVHHLLLAHGSAVRAFRSLDMGTAKIGIVIDVWRQLPVRAIQEDAELAQLEEAKTFRYFMSPIFKGHYPQVALDWLAKQDALPVTEPADMALISTPIDFLGVNCYSVNRVSGDPAAVDREKQIRENPDLYTAVGWEIYPRAIYDAVMTVKRDFSGDLPLYLTENGAAFDDEISADGADMDRPSLHDPRRIAFLRGYLAELQRAIQDGADVRGYYAWSLMDNFEWSAGYAKRFGLLYTDYATQQRIWKDSAYWYQDVIRKNGVEIGLNPPLENSMEPIIPRPEYPRPQFVRPDWLCLNGEWQFEIDAGDSGSGTRSPAA